MSLKPREVDFDPTWARIHRTIETVISLQNINHSEWNDCFSDVYALCVSCPNSQSKKLYDHTEAFIRKHVKELLKVVKASNELLVSYNKVWSEVSQGIRFLDSLYLYLNNQHIRKRMLGRVGDSFLEIGAMGMNQCKEILIQPLRKKLVHLLLDGLRRDRHDGDSPNQFVFHGVIHSFVKVEEYKTENNLEFYQTVFEAPYLKVSSEYFASEASRLLQEYDSSQYMEKVLQKFNEEDLRSRKYLHPSSYSKVAEECGKRMVTDHLDFLIGECKRMIEEENEKDLKNLYLLLKFVSTAFEAVIKELQRYMTKKGLEAIDTPKGNNIPQAFVESFLAFHDKFSSLIQKVFSSDREFLAALDKASGDIINHVGDSKKECQSPELLSKYCDSFLNKSGKTCSENEIDNKLTQAITLFKYLADKDVFRKFYSRMLTKRLIHKQSISMDAEESMINKMRLVCGHDFTTKLHRMFNDIRISSDLNSCFSEFLRTERVELDINFSVTVLQAGAWPLVQASVSTFAIPQQLEKSVQKFEAFYNVKFSGRRLSWLHHLCSSELKLCYLKKPYIITMTTYQMAILLLYERVDVLSYEEISASTKLNDEQLQKHIKSFLDSKLLLATDSEKPIEAGSSFKLNKEYSNKRLKFKLLPPAPKETAQAEVKLTRSSVEAERNAFLQAAIVRIMKERKILVHNSLIQEVLNQAKDRFVPNVQLIKKCIETLIDKGYIERTADSANEYSYVA